MSLSNSIQNDFESAKAESWKIFDRISSRYDGLNRFFSFGLDVLWRKRLARFLPGQNNLTILDVATGTADVLLYLIRQNPHISRGYGIDLADKMLCRGREKVQQQGGSEKIILQHGDAQQIPFPENHFDAVTIAFGIRNMPEPRTVLAQMLRVLKSRGRALVLEFSLPPNRIVRFIYLVYLRQVIPTIGAIISGDRCAYRYLNRTVETFPSGKVFCDLMTTVGFKNVTAHPLTFGIATIYQGEKK